jgi:hypothetical protein
MPDFLSPFINLRNNLRINFIVHLRLSLPNLYAQLYIFSINNEQGRPKRSAFFFARGLVTPHDQGHKRMGKLLFMPGGRSQTPPIILWGV